MSTATQINLFDIAAKESKNPCIGCAFSAPAGCGHIDTAPAKCEAGSFRVGIAETHCPTCGNNMEMRQAPLGCDGAGCPVCGTQVIFNNKGARLGWFEAWRLGMVAGE